MQRLLTDPLFEPALAKYESACKEVHKNNINMVELIQEERSELVEAYNWIADAVEQYVERSLRIQGRLEE